MAEEKFLISRRDFLKISGTLAGVFAVATQLPEGLTLLKEVSAEEAEKLKAEAEVEKRFYRSLGFCGGPFGSNLVEVYVKNGRIVRITPLHYDREYKPEEFNPWKIEVRGKTFEPPMKTLPCYLSLAYKKRVYSPNRVKYPLKRVDFDPKAPPERRNQQNRGKSGFVRISWDEALDIIESELKRIKETYGPFAILSQADFHGETKTVHGRPGATMFLLRLFGGCTMQARNPDSWEGWYWGGKHVWGMDENVGMEHPNWNVGLDILQNGEVVLFEGGDPETTIPPFGGKMPTLICNWFKEVGIKIIGISPDLNYAEAVHADKWIPIRPNTDVALHLAIAYVWITEGTYDKDYVSTHTFGFDKFKAYVLGEEDGIPKTPKWAEAITGVPARIIKALARLWASKRTSTAHFCGGPMIRGPYATEPGRTLILLLAMQGVGKPGVHQLANSFSVGWKMGLPKVAPSTSAAYRWLTIVPVKPLIAKTLIPDAILNPPISWYGNTLCLSPVEDQFVKYEFPPEGYPEIHAIWTETPCWTTCWNGGYKMIEAFRSPKIEFILAQHPWLEDDCLFADVILPVTTTFENDIDIIADGMANVSCPAYDAIVLQYKCIEPIGESKSDTEICEMIAKRLGLLEKFTEGKTHEEWVRVAFEKSGVADMISWDEFKKKQYFVVPTDPKWKEVKPGLMWYWELPEGKGLHTKSGKIEFYAQWLAEHFPDDKERPPVPHYIPYGKTWQESLVHPKAKKYPLLIVSNHPRWRVHAEGDDITWLREIPTCKIRGSDGYLYEPVWINPVDAAKRGIKHGDIVKVYNDRGTVLGAAYVTERIIPGAVYQDHGARLDLISLEPLIDRGGANNLIAPKENYPMVPLMLVSSYLVEVEKVNISELMTKYPEAFKRKLHPDVGPCYETWVSR